MSEVGEYHHEMRARRPPAPRDRPQRPPPEAAPRDSAVLLSAELTIAFIKEYSSYRDELLCDARYVYGEDKRRPEKITGTS